MTSPKASDASVETQREKAQQLRASIADTVETDFGDPHTAELVRKYDESTSMEEAQAISNKLTGFTVPGYYLVYCRDLHEEEQRLLYEKAREMVRNFNILWLTHAVLRPSWRPPTEVRP